MSLLFAALLLGACEASPTVTCGDNVQGATVAQPECLCNCPDGIPPRQEGGGGEFCVGPDAADGDDCCYWQNEEILLVGTCAAHVCVIPIKAP